MTPSLREWQQSTGSFWQPLESRHGSSDEGSVCFVQRTMFYNNAYLITGPTSWHSSSWLLLFNLVLGTQPSGLVLEISLCNKAAMTGVRQNGPGLSSAGPFPHLIATALLSLSIASWASWRQRFGHRSFSTKNAPTWQFCASFFWALKSLKTQHYSRFPWRDNHQATYNNYFTYALNSVQ